LAKSKKETIENEDGETVVDPVEKIRAELAKTYKTDVFVPAQAVFDKKRQVIPISPALDIGLGGGIPEGSHVIMSGPPKGGKTTTTLHFASKAQRPEYGGRHVFIINAEQRLKRQNLECISGLDLSKLTVIESNEDKILNAVDYLTISVEILKTVKNCIMIFDSYSRLVPEKCFTDGIGTSTRGGTAKLLSDFCDQTAPIIAVNNNIIIGITHIMANTSGYGSPTIEKGGNGIAYQADIKLRMKKAEHWSLTEGGPVIGHICHWTQDTNALGVLPYQKIESYIRFGKGIDEAKEIVEIASGVGLLKKAGSWLSIEPEQEGEEEIKVQGAEKMIAYLQEHPAKLDQLYKKIRELYGCKS